MKKTFAVIGLGRFGSSVCRTLMEANQEVLAVDRDENRVNEFMNVVTHAVVGNAQDENTLKALGIQNFDHVVIAIGEDIQASILVTLMVKELGVPFVTAKAQNGYHAKVLDKVGANKVVHPERDMGIRVAHNLVSKNILDYIDLTDDYTLAEVKVTNANFYGQTLVALDFRKRFALTVIAIRRGKNIIISPSGTENVKEGDSLLVVGETNAVEKLDEEMDENS